MTFWTQPLLSLKTNKHHRFQSRVMNHNFSARLELFFQSLLMQTQNRDSQQVLSHAYPFPEVAKEPLCVEHHIFLAGQPRRGIFSVPWLQLAKGSHGVFFAKPQWQLRLHGAPSPSPAKQLNVYVSQKDFMLLRERAAVRREMFQSPLHTWVRTKSLRVHFIAPVYVPFFFHPSWKYRALPKAQVIMLCLKHTSPVLVLPRQAMLQRSLRWQQPLRQTQCPLSQWWALIWP